MALPNESDLTLFLSTLGVSPSGTEDLSALIASTIAEFEGDTGRTKYEGDSTDTEARYTMQYPSGREVQLVFPVNYWSISEIRVGYNGTPGSGAQLTEFTDYTLYPGQAGKPIEAINFLTRYNTMPGAILVTGKQGAFETMPDDVKRAILSRAASLALVDAAGAVGDMVEQKQGDRTVKFASALGQSTVDRLNMTYRQAVARYKRVVL